MAENIATAAKKASSDAVSAKHNIANINATVAAGLDRMYAKEQEIQAAKDKHVAPLQEDLRKIKQGIKADTGLKLKALDVQYQVMKVYRDADQFVKEGEADQLRDDIKVVFAAMQEGGMVDWVDVAEAQADKPKTNGAKKSTKAKPASEGSAATH